MAGAAGMVAVLMVLAGCGSEASSAGSGGGDASDGTPAEPDLDGRTFLSTRVSPEPLVHGTRIRLSFEEPTLRVTGGCNHIGADYSIDDDRLVTTAMAGTEMGCPPPLMEQDRWLTDVLSSEPALTLDGKKLTLRADDGTVIELMDHRAADPDQGLTGTKWRLEAIVQGSGGDAAVSSVPAGVKATLAFNEEGELMVETGCNSGSAKVEVTDDVLRLRPVITTLIGCIGDAMRVERAVLAVLQEGEVSYDIEADRLTLTRGDRGLVYRAE